MQNSTLLSEGCDIKERKTKTCLHLMSQPFMQSFCNPPLGLFVYLTVSDYGYNTVKCCAPVLCLIVLCLHVWQACVRDHKCVHVSVGVCDPADTFSLCAEEKGATPHFRCSSTNLVVTIPFIPPIGHGALWQSHVFAHWERQFLANFNRTVAHKKGRATCTGGGANPTHLFTRLLTCLVCECVLLDWLMLYLVIVQSCWMLNVTDLPLVPNVSRSFWCDMWLYSG